MSAAIAALVSLARLPPATPEGADREHGFAEALRRHDLDDSRVIRLGAPPIPVEQGGEAIVEMMHRWPDTDAVMFVSDRTAFGALQECLRRGWGVPEKVAIAGFGNFDMARNCHPRITTTSIDCYEMGRFAAERIVTARKHAADGRWAEPEVTMIPLPNSGTTNDLVRIRERDKLTITSEIRERFKK